MSSKVYSTIDELDDAISDAISDNPIDPNTLRLYLDGGEVIVKDADGKDVYRGSEQDTLIEFFMLFLGIQHEVI